MSLTSEPVWLEVDLALKLHLRSIERFGGSTGIRDKNLLESAIARPRTLLSYNPDITIFQLAAAYTFSVVKNHPFIDGNKRTGVLLGYIFLFRHGIGIDPDSDTLADAIEQLAAGELSEAELAAKMEQWSV